jgi:hypothetical protein
VGKSLLPLFESESTGLDEGGKKAVAYAIAEAFNSSTVSAETLARKNLEPTLLSRDILAQFPASQKFFGEAEASFYQRILEEACRAIVNIAPRLPAFSKEMFAEILHRTEDLLTMTQQILIE